VKDLRVYPTVRGLALALTITISIILAGFGSALAGGKKAPVEIGFVGVPPLNFQNVLLNVQAISINPNASAGANDPKWQKIGVPAGIGQGGNATPELQIDLNTSQNIPQLFNTANVKPGTYRIAQLLLDPNNPGTLVPDCPNARSPEGCINYPIQLANPGSPINLIAPAGTSLINASKGALAPLLMQLQMAVNTIPVQPGAAYIVTVSLAPVATQVTGTVMGSVAGGSGSQAKHLRKLAVTAEAIGTNTEIASVPVDSKGNYTLVLPAASGPDVLSSFGTLYDLALAGGGDSYGAIRLEPLFPGTILTPPPLTNILTNQTLGSISGTIKDNCTQATIAGATIQLLIPPSNSTLSDPSGDCSTLANLGECVSVATANTNNAGDFPLPGSLTIPAAFDSVPILKSGTYTMMVSAPGYDSFFTPVNATSGKKSGGNCSTGKTVVPCKILLTSGSISGTIPIESQLPGQTTLVQVFAEDHGTNNIVSALPMPKIVRSGSDAVTFKINVPTVPIPPATGTRTFDLFATTIDLFQGVTDPYQGHTIVVMQDVDGPMTPGPGACATATALTPADTIRCVGHGSMVGSVANANLGTSVVLSKNDVQITNTAVQNQAPNVPSTNVFSFCVPGDTYTVQKLQLPKPEAGVTPSVMPVPVLDPAQFTVTVPPASVIGGPTPTSGPIPTPTSGPTPTATPTPTLKCPTTCSNPDGSCPGVCNNMPLGQVL
jgi:hypothetical protein